MPSPFPGMDPFIEAQKWSSFHHRVITSIADTLVSQLRPRYEVDPEERVYLESVLEEPSQYVADLAVSSGDFDSETGVSVSTIDVKPTLYSIPHPQEERESYIVIRQSRGRDVVAIIEVLSPTNKRGGSDGRREYLSKRASLLTSTTHLVEIDLLLKGQLLLPSSP